jgi:hypothetical protein
MGRIGYKRLDRIDQFSMVFICKSTRERSMRSIRDHVEMDLPIQPLTPENVRMRILYPNFGKYVEPMDTEMPQ